MKTVAELEAEVERLLGIAAAIEDDGSPEADEALCDAEEAIQDALEELQQAQLAKMQYEYDRVSSFRR